MEDDVFFLMERQEQTYVAVMDMPYSRRKRFVDKKYTMEKEAQNRQNKRPRAVPRRRR
jgi:transposase InsO family protein